MSEKKAVTSLGEWNQRLVALRAKPDVSLGDLCINTRVGMGVEAVGPVPCEGLQVGPLCKGRSWEMTLLWES